MRVTLNDLMNKLSVGYVLGPYETFPWSSYNAEKGMTCSAEVRMGMDNDEVEAEIQIMNDEPDENNPAMEHICYIRITPTKDDAWTTTSLRIRNKPYGDDVYNWEEKSCIFFSLVVQKLKIDEIPDIDELIEKAFKGDESFADQRGGGGGKKPKINTSQLTGMKKGGGF